ncbi:hypothetical protein MIR68_003503 [Amoeboaphelidium protococcarum]|nr:hypothetical protein MIR68_003503 [Amoeboaphelidium protococcarum]
MYSTVFAVLSVVATSMVMASSPASCDADSSYLNAVLTYTESFSDLTQKWCADNRVFCSYGVRVANGSSQLSMGEAQTAFVKKLAGEGADGSSFKPVGLVIEDVGSLLGLNTTNFRQYTVTDKDAARTTLQDLKKQLLGEYVGKFTPFVVMPEVGANVLFGSAMAAQSYSEVIKFIEENGFVYWYVPVGRDDTARLTAGTYYGFVSNFYYRKNNNLLLNLNFGVNPSKIEQDDTAYWQRRQNYTGGVASFQSPQYWESISALNQFAEYMNSKIRAQCPDLDFNGSFPGSNGGNNNNGTGSTGGSGTIGGGSTGGNGSNAGGSGTVGGGKNNNTNSTGGEIFTPNSAVNGFAINAMSIVLVSIASLVLF